MEQNNLAEVQILPSEDFNKYVNGKWMENNPIPEKYSKWGTFEILHEENLNRLRMIIENVDKKINSIKKYVAI